MSVGDALFVIVVVVFVVAFMSMQERDGLIVKREEEEGSWLTCTVLKM